MCVCGGGGGGGQHSFHTIDCELGNGALAMANGLVSQATDTCPITKREGE